MTTDHVDIARDEVRLERLRRRCRLFAESLPPTMRGPYRADKRWLRRLFRELQAFFEACARSESPRLIIEIPPQYGKSEAVKRAIVWAMGRYGLPIALATYSADLALDHSRAIRDHSREEVAAQAFPGLAAPPKEPGKSLAVDRVDNWRTANGARLFAVGVGGPLTGRSPRAIVIDDPHKDEAEASSATVQERVWGWYRSVVYTRASANKSGILAMHTRWDDGDLIGRLRAEEKAGGEAWRVVSFSALAEEADDLGRQPGDPLDPDIQTAEDLAVTRRAMGSRRFAALYQQRPRPAEGSLLKVAWLSHRYRLPPDMQARMCQRTILTVDGAATDGAGDHTVIQRWGLTPTHAYLLRQWRGQWDYPTMRQVLRDAIASTRPDGIYVEDASSGRAVVQELRREIPGVVPVSVSGLGSKGDRIRATEALWESGSVLLPSEEHWPEVGDLVDRLARITGRGAEVDDEADAATIALRAWRGDAGQSATTADLLDQLGL
jgi:predicted phage terminase large subunit-like protein